MVFSWVEQKSLHKWGFCKIRRKLIFFGRSYKTEQEHWIGNGALLISIAPLKSHLKHSWKTAKLRKCLILKILQLLLLDYVAPLIHCMKLRISVFLIFLSLFMMKICRHSVVFPSMLLIVVLQKKLHSFVRLLFLQNCSRWRSVIAGTIWAKLSSKNARKTKMKKWKDFFWT